MSDERADNIPTDIPLDPFADPAAGPPPLSEPRTGPTAETGDQHERRCPFHRSCVCSHTECRDGWLDVDEPDPTPMDPGHVRNARCPRCDDARLMASELQGMKGGKR